MEITVHIDGKDVPFKSSGAVAKRYMMQFQRDLLKDVLKMGVNAVSFETMTDVEKLEWMRENVDFNIFYDIAWTFAKTANPSIPDPLTWLDSFGEFPLYEIIEPIQDLLSTSFSTRKK